MFLKGIQAYSWERLHFFVLDTESHGILLCDAKHINHYIVSGRGRFKKNVRFHTHKYVDNYGWPLVLLRNHV